MPLESFQFDVDSHGGCEVIDLSGHVAQRIQNGRLRDGLVTVFVTGSTAAITTTEFEPGLVHHDLKAFFEKVAPPDGAYQHEQTWNDDNGHSHICAALLGPSLTVPFLNRQLKLGTWQQIVLIDFDTRPRKRTIILQSIGE